MTKIQKLISTLLMFVIALVISDCGCSGSAPHFNEINKLILEKFEKADKVKSEIPGRITIAVDITQSMRGFVMNKNIGFCKFLDNFYSRFNKIELTIKGLRMQLDTIESFNSLFNSSLYKWKATDFSLIKGMIQQDRVFILISDFQFNKREDYRGIISKMQDFLKEGYFIQVRGGKPHFKGHVWHELDKEQIEEYTGLRPLYALIIGTQQYFEMTDKTFDEFNIWPEKITFVRQLINDFNFSKLSSQLSKKLVPDESAKFFNKYLSMMSSEQHSFTLEVNAPILNEWLAQPGTTVSPGTDSTAQKKLQQGTQEQVKLPPESVKLEICRLIIDNNGQIKTDSADFNDVFESLVAEVKRDETLCINLKTKAISNCDNFLFKIKIQPRTLPGWVEAWSCSADDDMETVCKKTVLLKEFIQSITNRVDLDFSIATLYLPLVSD